MKTKTKKTKKERAETVLLDYNNQREECAERNDTAVKGYQNRAVKLLFYIFFTSNYNTLNHYT